MNTTLRVFCVATLLVPCVGAAQPAGPPPGPPPVVRGTIVALANDTLTLKTDAGKTATIQLSQNWRVTVLKPVDVSTIQPGSFIGTAEMPQKDGTGRSLEVHVCPPGVKAGEGHYGWDSKPGSMMTNGTVGKVTANPKGRELEVSYPNGERKIVVPTGVPIVQFTDGDRSQVKPGIPAFLIAPPGKDGTLTSAGIVIGVNGAKPPM
jgi:hypothetical protein